MTRDDTLTLSHQNLVTQYWMQKIDPALPSLVAVEYATELQAGTQITALVQKIAKRADALLKTKGHLTATKVVMKVNEVEDEAALISKLDYSKSSSSRGDGRDRREQRGLGPVSRKLGNQSRLQVFGRSAKIASNV